MSTVESRPLEVDYDRDRDVLYVSLGPPRPSFVREDPDVEGLHYCYAVEDRKLCGVTVVWYSTQDKRTLQRKIPFPIALP